MARARNLKPSLFKNELLGVADPLLTILFESLWCLADREGRLEDRPLRIKAETFPYREGLDVNVYLTELERMGFICRYEASGGRFIQVLNFAKHQNPHKTEKASDLPQMPSKSEGCATTVISPLNTGSRPADSLLPPTDTLEPQQGAGAPIAVPATVIETDPDKLAAIEEELARHDHEPPTQVAKRQSKVALELPAWLPRDAWVAYVAMRKKIKKPLTDEAIPLAIGKLDKLRSEGHPPQAVLEQSTLNSWQGLFEVRADGRGSPARSNGRPSINASFVPGADADIFDELPIDFRP